eukprot:9725-Heterococcus_DN1.PRE.3
MRASEDIGQCVRQARQVPTVQLVAYVMYYTGETLKCNAQQYVLLVWQMLSAMDVTSAFNAT